MKALTQKIHFCNSHKATLKPKIAKEYFFSTQRKIKKQKIALTEKIKLRNRTADNDT